MTDTTVTVTPATPDEAVDMIDAATVYALRRFKHENAPAFAEVPAPVTGFPEASAEELRDLLIFAGRSMGNGDPSVPRHLEAYRVISLVPEPVGAALFADQTGL